MLGMPLNRVAMPESTATVTEDTIVSVSGEYLFTSDLLYSFLNVSKKADKSANINQLIP